MTLLSILSDLNNDLYGLTHSFDLKFHQSIFSAFRDCSKCTNYNWYHCHFYVPQLLQIEVFDDLLAFFPFHSKVWRNSEIHKMTVRLGFFFGGGCKLTLRLVFWPAFDYIFVSKNPREFYKSHFLGRILFFFFFFIYDLLAWSNFFLFYFQWTPNFSSCHA